MSLTRRSRTYGTSSDPRVVPDTTVRDRPRALARAAGASTGHPLRVLTTLLLLLLLAAGTSLVGVPDAAAASPRPTGLKVTSTSTGSVTLSWKSSAAGASYRVKWSTSKSFSHPSYRVVSDHRATLSGLDAGTRYWFKVRRVTKKDKATSSYSAKVSATTRTPAAVTGAGLRVASYNVRCANCDSDRPYERSWTARRDAVAANIRAQHLDVVGLQEASQGWLKGGDGQKVDLSQFEDLRNRLGGSWRLTNTRRNNCVRSTTPTRCERKDQGASQGTKIVYDASRVVLLRQGSKALPSAAKSNQRYVAWAVFRQRSTGKSFFFADAHLEPNKDHALHVKEARALADEVERRNVDDLPTLIVGDMNSHKNTKPSNGVYDVLVGQRHYVDPLGNTWHSKDKAGTRAKTQTVEKRVNTWLSSWNDFQKTAKGDRARLNGTYLDYVFTSRMRVVEWETVADIDADGRFRTPPPSDHNLVRATVVLP